MERIGTIVEEGSFDESARGSVARVRQKDHFFTQLIFKNVAEPVTIFEVTLHAQPREGAVLDPVGRMQVRPETAPARLPFGSKTYYLCSFGCAQAFAASPENYAEA